MFNHAVVVIIDDPNSHDFVVGYCIRPRRGLDLGWDIQHQSLLDSCFAFNIQKPITSFLPI